MQINRLQIKPIVTNKALYLACGARPCTVESKSTSDCYSEPTPYGARKTQLIALGNEIAKAAIAKQNSDGQSPDMTPRNPIDM